ncbi:hypothetical protein TNCT_697701 [Trichonephila clavata]|uniref:Uncharacterized protein n=1 Tax=Trichonephila clavata TaxID=2740835 RepID=A0A8X6FFZ8_TRICU|nr:hypothetical protein TNCT_697701 [Trichonephila clavata]
MSNSEDDSFAEVENKDTVQLEDSPQWKSVCKSLNTGSASPNAKGDQASVAPSYSEPQTEKIGIKADLPNIRRVIGNRRKNRRKLLKRRQSNL